MSPFVKCLPSQLLGRNFYLFPITMDVYMVMCVSAGKELNTPSFFLVRWGFYNNLYPVLPFKRSKSNGDH